MIKCHKCGEGLDKGQIAKGKELEEYYEFFDRKFYICWECDTEERHHEPDFPEFSDADPGL